MTKFQKALTFNALIIAIASLASRALGLFRDRVLASEFGAGNILDSYYAAFRIPDLLFNLLILGALSAAFIPIFTEYITRGDKKNGWRLINSVINIAIIVLLGIGVVVFIASPYLLRLITPGFDQARLSLAINFTRIMLLSPIFLGVSSIIGGALNSFGRFFVFSIAPIFYNIGIIFGAIFLVPIMGPVGLAWGVVIGAALHLLVQLPVLIYLGYRWQPSFEFRHPDLIRIFMLMTPVTFGLAISQLSLFVDTIIGSTLKIGSIAVINFANNLASLPIGLIGISFALSAFPIMARAASLADEEEFASSLNFSFRQIIYFIIPASVCLLVFRAQIVRLVLGAGLFSWRDTILTSRVLGYFAFGLFAQALIPLVVRAFYALKDSKTPVKISLFSLTINIIGSLTLPHFFGVVGLAMAMSLAVTINITLLLFSLSSKISRFSILPLIWPTSKIIMVAAVSGLIGYFALFAFEPLVNTLTFVGLLFQTIAAVVLMGIVYLVLSLLFKFEELRIFIPRDLKKVLKKLFIRPAKQGSSL